jgi:FHA domain-containing protein
MKLQELEARLQSLIEIRLINVLPGQRPEDVLIQKLTAVMLAAAAPDEHGQLVAPNVYTLQANPHSTPYWHKAEVLETLLSVLEIAAQQAEIRFDQSPSITIAEDTSVAAGDFNLIASYRARSLAETKDMKIDPESLEENAAGDAIPENAFLIIEGVKVFQLSQPVVNIGRRLDNTLVVDDPRVSRNHAQLRAIKGRYVLFDLNSTGGTFVNGQRATQTVLYPGDVISLAGASLIFGQDNPLTRPDLSDTSPRNDAGSERSTAVIRTKSTTLRKKK